MSTEIVPITENSLQELVAMQVRTYGGFSRNGRVIDGIEVFGVRISSSRLQNSDCIELMIPLLQKNIQEFIENIQK